VSPQLWLLRHAESEWNAAGRWQGRADPPLSAHGREQAARAALRVAEALAGQKIGALYCSTLERARVTAGVVGARLGLEPRPVPGLEELDVGRWSGLSTDEIRRREPELLAAFETGDPDVRPGGGETRREMRARVLGAVAGLARRDGASTSASSARSCPARSPGTWSSPRRRSRRSTSRRRSTGRADGPRHSDGPLATAPRSAALS
jgi:probable phosphoglycerate mutase